VSGFDDWLEDIDGKYIVSGVRCPVNGDECLALSCVKLAGCRRIHWTDQEDWKEERAS
jgi:hypothetical protein